MSNSVLTSHHLSAVLSLPEGKEKLEAGVLVQILKECVEKVGLSTMADVVADFSPHGASAVVVLKESHVAAHIWPEHQACTVDIHVCDYLEDNLSKAKNLAKELSLAFDTAYSQDDWQILTVKGTGKAQCTTH